MPEAGWMRDALWLKLALRLAVGYAVLSIAAIAWGRYYVDLLLPLYHAVVAALEPLYLVGPLAITTLPTGEPVIASEITTRTSFLLGGGVVPTGISITASTLLGHAVQHPVLLFAVGLAWPLANGQQRIMQLALLSLMLVVVECLDIPMVLLGSVDDLLYANVSATGLMPPWRVHWMNAMNGGGRHALCIAAAIFASLVTARLCVRVTTPASTPVRMP